MKADDLFQPLFSRAQRLATPREYRWGGVFLAAMAIGMFVLDGIHGWPGALFFGVPAIGSFQLARRIEESPTLPPGDGAA
jgi:hypothetical protein